MLTLSHRKDRHFHMDRQLKQLGYDPDNINHIRKFSIVYTTTWKYNHIITKAFNEHYSARLVFTKPNEYDCTRNHYNIIKTAYDLGYKNILIIEDDIQLLKPEYLLDMVDKLPADYSLCHLSGFTTDMQANQCISQYHNGNLYIKEPEFRMWCTAMYAMNQEGMRWYMSFIEERISVADMPLYVHPTKGYYVSSIPWAKQLDKDTCESDIRSKETDTIDYKNSNAYESLVPESMYIKPDFSPGII